MSTVKRTTINSSENPKIMIQQYSIITYSAFIISTRRPMSIHSSIVPT